MIVCQWMMCIEKCWFSDVDVWQSRWRRNILQNKSKLTHLRGPTLPPPLHDSYRKDICPVPVQIPESVGKMGNMATEIVAFLLTVSGWILVSSTLPTDYWKVSSVDGTVITTATFWSNLWKTCVTDSTGVSNCKDFPSMLALDGELWHYI